MSDCNPKKEITCRSTPEKKQVTDQKPAKYTPPTHVCQFTPDFSILSFPKPRKKKRRRDDFAFLCGAAGSTSSKKGPGSKKRKKKKASKLECHKSESFQFGLLHPASKCTFPDVEDTSDSVLEASQVVHGTKNEVSQVEEQSLAFKVPQENHPDDTSLSPKGAKIQVIIDHTYLGPLCLQFTTYPSVADLKNELMERTGLPVRNQCLYLNGKKLLSSQDTRLLFDDNQESLTLMLSIGSLKGGVPPKEEAAGGKQGSVPPDSEEVPAKGEAAEGEEGSVPTSSHEALSPMETWDVEKTAAWLDQIGLPKKYIDFCQKEHVNGQALLLLASKRPEQLVAVLKLKMGPKSKLLRNLEPHLKVFKFDKPQAAGNSAKTFDEWTAEELCSWLMELGVPEDSAKMIEEEEIDGADLTSLIKESLKEKLQLKEGLWVVLEHEVFLRSEKASSSISEDDTKETDGSSNPQEESKQPLPAIDPSEKSTFQGSKNVTLTMEEKLQKLFGIDIQVSTGSANTRKCVVRSVFVKRGGGANELESLLNFIVVTKDKLPKDKVKKLWARIREKTADWLELLPESHLRLFKQNEGCESFVHLPTKTKVSPWDGEVNQMFLGSLKDDEYERNMLVVLVDKQLLEDKKSSTYKFSFDKKRKCFYDINVKESKYHASFDPNSGSQDLKWSKHFRSLRSKVKDSSMDLLDLPLSEKKSSPARDVQRPQIPRLFNAECAGSYYQEGCFLDTWETGPKDLIRPAHELKILQTVRDIPEGTILNKFLYETLRFACGCLNNRTNGTIHFGVADEIMDQACGYQPREIVGCSVNEKPLYTEKLTEFIDKCFVGDSRSNVKNCIRPPVFIPIRGEDGKYSDKVVIEVDIEPSYTLCSGEIFKADFKSLDRGNREGATAFIRDGSQTRAIVELQDMENHVKNLSRLDEFRKKREEESNSSDGLGERGSLGPKYLHGKLRRLLCANKDVLDSSVYPILVLSKPESKSNQQFLSKTLSFVQHINWQVVIDFDDEASDCNGVCSVFKSGPAQCDIHEAEDYDGDEDLIYSIDTRTHWIFGNGCVNLNKEAVGFKQWHNSRRKKGLSLVIQSVAKKIPHARAVVLFLLFSKDYLAMANIFEDFCTNLYGPNQLVYVAENAEIVQDWEAKLTSTCLEKHERRERGVIGMSWREFQECMQQMVKGIDQQQRYITMYSGSPYPLNNVCFSNIDIIGATECDELLDLSPKERLEMSAKVEIDFYRGYTVTWKNFWFTDKQRNHVLRRANYKHLKTLIEKIHSRGLKGKVHTVIIYHHFGAGATTMARQALWDFRHSAKFPFRCAVVTKIDDSTCKELLLLANVGYEDDSKISLRPPVLALVEDTDDIVVQEFLSQVTEHSNQRPRTESPFCVLLLCKETQKPYDDHLKEKKTSVYLEQCLIKEEVEWFKDKYTEMKGKFHHKDPEHDFETYANENLISFMIMKENFNPNYALSVVERNLSQVTSDERTLLKYTSLLSLYNPYPVFVSCFDTIMHSVSLLRRRIYRNWVEDLTHSARLFLREVDCSSTHLGTGSAIAIVHPVIASTLLDKIAEKEQKAISQLVLDFLKSSLLENRGTSFTSTYLYDGAKRMLKLRRKFDYGDDEGTKFSPLIEKILYVKETKDGEKVPTEDSINQAAEVLGVGLERFEDPMLAQQMARVFYINAKTFSESAIDSCFAKALEYCKIAINRSPNNSFLFDTMGRIYEKQMTMLFDPVLKEYRIVGIEDVTAVLPLAFEAIEWFQKSFAASTDFQINSGLRGELFVMFYLLDVLRCAKIFRGQGGLKKLQQYLAYCQVIPDEVEKCWSKFHERIKDLRNRFYHCMEGLSEDFTVFKGNRLDEKMISWQIGKYKAKYFSYFGEGDIKWNTESPEERRHHRWYQINQFLAGGIFLAVFSRSWFEETPGKTLKKIKQLAYLNYEEPIQEYYNDLLLIVSTSMALHSPHRWPRWPNSKCEVPQPEEEYREMYKFVEKLFAIEQGDEQHTRIYAHLLKVMFLWPREDLELNNYHVQDFYDSLQKLKERWGRKSKEHYDEDKARKEKVYKNMSFKSQTRQYTTLFYLGKGSGLDVFVHLNELTERENLDWENLQTKRRLKRLTGMIESENVIRVRNPQDAERSIDIYYSSFREGGFSKEEVSFYLGFSWANLIAVDVKYTQKHHRKESVRQGDVELDNAVKLPKYDVVPYDEYSSWLVKLRKKLKDIEALTNLQDEGRELDKNQKKKLQTEKDLRELQESFDTLRAQEEDISDKS